MHLAGHLVYHMILTPTAKTTEGSSADFQLLGSCCVSSSSSTLTSCERQNSKAVLPRVHLVIPSGTNLDTMRRHFADLIKVTTQLTLKDGSYLGGPSVVTQAHSVVTHLYLLKTNKDERFNRDGSLSQGCCSCLKSQHFGRLRQGRSLEVRSSRPAWTTW